MRRRQYAIAVLVLVTGILPLSGFIGLQLLENILALLFFVLALALCVRTDHDAGRWSATLPIRAHRAIAVPLVVLWGLLVLTTLFNPSRAALLRLPAYVLTSFGCVFVIPAALDRRRAYYVFAAAGALLTLIGLPSLVFGAISLGPFTLSAIPVTYPLFGIWEIHNPASVFNQPNPLALIAAVGLISALAVVSRERSRRKRMLFGVLAGICVIGVVVTRSRAIWGALAAVAALYVVYRLSGRSCRALAGATAIGMVGSAVIIIAVAGVLPEPFALDVNLKGRGASWLIAIEATAHRPLVGYGPGNVVRAAARFSPTGNDLLANSYLRMFAMTGIIGGVVYLALCANALRCALSRVRPGPFHTRDTGFVTLALLAIVLMVQLFEGLTFFGLALLSVIGMLFIGYAQPVGRSEHITLDLTGLSHAWEWISTREQRIN